MKTNFLLKYIFSFVWVMILNSCSENNSAINKIQFPNCDTTSFHLDNNQNDTSKMILIQSVAFDTTANLLHISVFDKTDKQPVLGAKILLEQNEMKVLDSTSNTGEFEIFKNNFSGSWKLKITATKYHCLQINNVL